ncbi:S8 family serine peptidase [Streptomyces camelliae]|uniref:S8 family serine peptidase n=2 Tax=Streptomyces camelliae TaxID=3004093 RepID=A0ABY7PHS2_9ACTN|nr:S8 family serine peptidase [Streptomyces sp. HUAS 2-6]WBO69229.1 S8 family serine peptidase [Streptomyces sp. HUAS 2-6]
MAAAVALAAGMTSPASARPAEPTATGGSALTARTHVTLITGDRVALDAKGRIVGLERAKGREHIPFQVRRTEGHTLVVPADAARLLASGTLDQRLFDVTELNKAATRKAQKNGLKVIVGYRGGAAAAKAGVRDAGRLRRTLTTLDADAVQTPVQDTTALWHAVTADARTASGIAHVWLDGVRTASLDTSVPQIGAPTAWKAGYTGKGVKVAVLDTGVDTSHADLKDQVIASRNFTAAKDATDHFGHGTHVASIVAGTGAESAGRYTGVAPGAEILNGKVLDDTGSGDDSGILAGMEWAASQGASVVNLSLGGYDSPGIDPLEAEVNKLSETKGILFAIAAGNDGPHSLGSPGSADAALTVGAVDKKDKLADFSSTGPRVGDGAIKPDVTAPGVDITAAAAKGSVIDQEVGEKPEGYLTISGTSMATPHVAGAAAILKQEHPDWGYAELKGALTGSAKGGAYTPFQQGSGRIAVDKAIRQSVIAEPVSVSFGVQQWPHTDDKPVTKKVTYRNLGDQAATLTLSSTALDPKGKAAPAGFFTLGARQVTVPAHGTASVDLTVNTKLGGTLDGAYSAYVTATGTGQSVRTAAAVTREVESYDVTVKFIGRDGKPTKNYSAGLTGVAGLAGGTDLSPYDPSGTVKVRAPKGTYILNTSVFADPEDFGKGVDWIAQPKLTVGKKQTITIDARQAKPVDITVPAKGVTSQFANPGFDVKAGDGDYGYGFLLDSYKNFRTAHLGPQLPAGSLYQQWDAHWSKGASEEYDVTAGGPVKQLATGYTKHFKASEMATVKVRLGAAASGKTGSISATGWLPGSSGASSVDLPQKLPGTRTLHLSATGGVNWQLGFTQYGGKDKDGSALADAGYQLGEFTFRAGRTYTKTVNTAVFGPHVGGGFGLFRDGDEIYGSLPLFADSAKHAGSSDFTSVTTTLYRDGTKIGSNDDPLSGQVFKVPAGEAAYRLTTSVKRSAKVAAASSRIDATWTFRSKKPSGDFAELPSSALRYGIETGLDSRVAAGKTVTFPVTVEGSAAGRNLKSLAVYVSYDGKTFKKVDVKGGRITLKNPAKGTSLSLRSTITDKQGNTSEITIWDAYFGT